MLGRLKCFFLGHLRGKRVSETHVACPRCTVAWERKPQKAKAATA